MGKKLICLFFLLTVSSSAFSQLYYNPVWNGLSTAYENNSELFGTKSYILSELREGASVAWDFTYTAGKTYRIIGVCDDDCEDLDLFVYNISGIELAKDILPDARPIVEFTAPPNGYFNVKAEMITCSIEPCAFGFIVLEKY